VESFVSNNTGASHGEEAVATRGNCFRAQRIYGENRVTVGFS